MLHMRPALIDQAVAFGANREQYPRFLIPSASVLGEGRVGVQAVLNLLENRFCLKQRFPFREAVVKRSCYLSLAASEKRRAHGKIWTRKRRGKTDIRRFLARPPPQPSPKTRGREFRNAMRT